MDSKISAVSEEDLIFSSNTSLESSFWSDDVNEVDGTSERSIWVSSVL